MYRKLVFNTVGFGISFTDWLIRNFLVVCKTIIEKEKRGRKRIDEEEDKFWNLITSKP